MRILEFASPGFTRSFRAFCRNAEPSVSLRQSVAKILEDIRLGGDPAVRICLETHDRVHLKTRDLGIDASEMRAAWSRLSSGDRRAMKDALRNIRIFNREGLPADWVGRNAHGARVGERFHPLDRVGIYIPRGLVSTVLMTCGLARLAGVPEIAVFTPSDPEGNVGEGLLGALHLCGITEAYRIGGVAAIGAMAFGTRTIRPVAKVFGPGNAYVVEAKRQVFGTIGVDLLPGPSEVMVIADASSAPSVIAADLLAQAEHGSGQERVFLVSPSMALIRRVHDRIRERMVCLPRKDAIFKVVTNGFLSIRTRDLADAAGLANEVAPEHLELALPSNEAKRMLKRITTAGAVMIGHWSATALGDFVAGPSHELPTGGAGRYASGLQVRDFMRRSSLIEYDEASLKEAAASAAAFSRMEGLDGHGRSVESRFES
ncbi:MAG: histidinol dehydrogenase [Opitutaceae bacterium]